MDANELRQRMAALPRPATELKAPYWEYWRMVLYDWILENDPADFGHCPAVYHTMLVNHWPGPVAYEFGHLPARFYRTLSIPHFGPNDLLHDSPELSMNLIHQAYHIQQWEQATGQRINTLDTIVEFGGGYGAMCLLCHRLGFGGKYIIYDLPEFSLLQEYYLSQFGLLANVTWNPVKKPKPVDLFMALYSLSEVEPGLREEKLVRAESYLYLYSGQWEAWDNVEYFQEDFPILGYVGNWKHTELEQLPDPQNWYSIGW